MPNLFLIDGVHGGGKSDLIAHCSAEHKSIFLKKYTTKKPDTDGFEREDLEYVSEEKFNSLIEEGDFIYKYPSYSNPPVRYLVSKKTLDSYLKEYKNVFVIIRSADVIQDIKKAYSEYLNVNVVSIFIYSDREKLKDRAEKQIRIKNPDLSDEEIQSKLIARLERNEECLQSYIDSLKKHDRFYDYVILNDLSKEQYYSCIENIIKKYKDFDKSFEKLTAFVIMPMPDNREGAHFYKVKEAIYKGAKNAGFLAYRSDDIIYDQDTIYGVIKKSIEQSTVNIIDLTNRRPNCYFEAGLAFERDRGDVMTAFLIAEKDTEIDFDLTDIRRDYYTYVPNEYGAISDLVEKLLLKFKRDHIFETI